MPDMAEQQLASELSETPSIPSTYNTSHKPTHTTDDAQMSYMLFSGSSFDSSMDVEDSFLQCRVPGSVNDELSISEVMCRLAENSGVWEDEEVSE